MMSRLSNMPAILQAQTEGYSAYLNGERIPDCPYDAHHPELRSAWVRGYAASRTDRTQANRQASIPEE